MACSHIQVGFVIESCSGKSFVRLFVCYVTDFFFWMEEHDRGYLRKLPPSSFNYASYITNFRVKKPNNRIEKKGGRPLKARRPRVS